MPSLTTPQQAYEQRIASQIDSASEQLDKEFNEWLKTQSIDPGSSASLLLEDFFDCV